jgi:hypothetical protein
MSKSVSRARVGSARNEEAAAGYAVNGLSEWTRHAATAGRTGVAAERVDEPKLLRRMRAELDHLICRSHVEENAERRAKIARNIQIKSAFIEKLLRQEMKADGIGEPS